MIRGVFWAPSGSRCVCVGLTRCPCSGRLSLPITLNFWEFSRWLNIYFSRHVTFASRHLRKLNIHFFHAYVLLFFSLIDLAAITHIFKLLNESLLLFVLDSAVNPQLSSAEHATEERLREEALGRPLPDRCASLSANMRPTEKVGKSWEHVETAAKARVLTVIELTKEMKILWNNFWANMLHIKSTLRPIVC